MADDVKLLPCPFCGAEAKLRADDCGDAWTPECTNTECSVDFPWYWDKADAVAVWNTRAKPAVGPATAGVLDQVARSLRRMDLTPKSPFGLPPTFAVMVEDPKAFLAEQDAGRTILEVVRAVVKATLTRADWRIVMKGELGPLDELAVEFAAEIFAELESENR